MVTRSQRGRVGNLDVFRLGSDGGGPSWDDGRAPRQPWGGL